MKRFLSKKRKQRGLAMVEMTIILPLLLLLLFAIMELGRAFFYHTQVQKLSRNSARYLVNVVGTGSTGVYTLSSDNITTAKNIVLYGSEAASGTSWLPTLSADHVTVSLNGNVVNVEVRYPYQPIMSALPNLFSNRDLSLSFNLIASQQMRIL
ncbi:TadE/TadG family type IV pilus assembly protein [Thaumasiovibrio sp. DFM-14]|uniref:TadE/TadG family type IV pilus assembly protein n=1 Tax=Thaumasiovibrio sp. DFM-14 TaxID=3384792 RepID=UPI0039A13E18